MQRGNYFREQCFPFSITLSIEKLSNYYIEFHDENMKLNLECIFIRDIFNCLYLKKYTRDILNILGHLIIFLNGFT